MAMLDPFADFTDHVMGERSAFVVLTEYGDYQSPPCGRAHAIVLRLLEDMGSSLCFVYRHYPMTQSHPHALLAAEVAEAAAAQGRFWPMHDILYENQDALEPEDLVGYATALHLDVARVARELEHHTHFDKVKRDFRSGLRSQVQGTPTFYIDYERYDADWDAASLQSALERAIAEKRHTSPEQHA